MLKHCAGTEEVGEPGQILSHADNVLPGLCGLRTVTLDVVTSVVVCSHVSPASVAPQLSPTGSNNGGIKDEICSCYSATI